MRAGTPIAGTGNLLRDAGEWRLLSLLFACPRAGWAAEVTALANEVEDSSLRSAAELAVNHGSEGLYHSLFGPGGPAPPREVSYQRLVQFGSLLSEITAYYRAFAYEPATREAPDHVSVECDFVAYLCLKQAYALHVGDHEHAAVTAEAAQAFIRDHLAVVAPPLAAELRASGIEYLDRAAGLLLLRVGGSPHAVEVQPAEPAPLPECQSGCGALELD